MNKLIPAVLFVTLVVFAVGSISPAHAQSLFDRDTTLLVVDRQAASLEPGSGGVVSSMIGLISNFREEHFLMYQDAADATAVLGPAETGTASAKAYESDVAATIAAGQQAGTADLVGSLSSAYNLLAENQARAGSGVYFLTGGNRPALSNDEMERLSVVLGLFKQRQWAITGLQLPGTTEPVTDFLSRVSSQTGGEVIEFTVPTVLKRITDIVLTAEARGTMADLGGGTMAANEVFTATVEIPPGTRETTMVFYKQDASGSLRLNNPSGFEASMGDRSVSSVVETPHAVIWSLVDPVPGAWTVDVKGVQGALSSWQYTQNKYSPALASHSAIPVDLSASIIAYVAEGGRKVTVEGVELAATVTTPGGSVITHRLHDDGVAGDSVAGDGYYSASMPPVGKTGDYVVDLALSWAGSNVAVISRTGFAAQYFPTVEVTPVQLVDIRPGEKVRVASALVHVQGEPYAIAPGTMTPVLSSDAESLGILEVTPRQVLEQNRAWEYDVYFTPGVEALHTLTFDLSVQYLGREYTFTTPSVVLSSIMPVIPAAPEPVAVVEPEPVVEAPAVTVITPVPFPVVPVTIGAATVVLLALAIAIYWLSRTRPYGYLYNDRNELIVDFSQIQRSAARLLFARSKVSGVELGAQGLERVTFRFDGGSVELNSPQVTPTIRVNNQPLIGDAPIHDRTWIGAHGKLYSFLVRPLMSPEPQPAAGDD